MAIRTAAKEMTTETLLPLDIKSALVSGASGFIGRRLCETLQTHQIRVTALMRTPAHGPWQSNLTVDLGAEHLPPETLEGIDTVFHLAGKAHAVREHRSDDRAYFRINTDGTRDLIKAAFEAKVNRFVFFSTVKAMGDDPQHCLDELCGLPPDSPYGQSKREAEQLVLAAASSRKMHVVVLRLPLVYGPGVKGNLRSMIDSISRNRFPPLGIRSNRRSMIHVDDVIRAALTVVSTEASAGAVYILTDGEPYSTEAVHQAMCVALDKPLPGWKVPKWALTGAARFGDLYARLVGRWFIIDSPALDRLTQSAWYSSEKIRTELGFATTRKLHDSMADMVKPLGH